MSELHLDIDNFSGKEIKGIIRYKITVDDFFIKDGLSASEVDYFVDVFKKNGYTNIEVEEIEYFS